MSKLEFDLLKYLVQNQWNPIDRKELLEKVWWDFEDYMFSRTVDVYIGYLRKKLWSDFIKTVKWFGYLIN
jgi:DNA-binding response OmpR family regulator